MRENHKFGYRTDLHTKKEKEEVNLGDVFGIVNKGVRSKQIDTFIKRTTGMEHFNGEIKYEEDSNGRIKN